MMKRALPIVIDIAEPCPVAWETMRGDDHQRFCDRCEKQVVNLSTVAADQVAELIRSGTCVSFEFRADASVVTAASKARRAAPAIVMAAALAAAVGCNTPTRTSGAPPPIASTAPLTTQSAACAPFPESSTDTEAVAIGQLRGKPMPLPPPSAPKRDEPPPRAKAAAPPRVHESYRTAGLMLEAH